MEILKNFTHGCSWPFTSYAVTCYTHENRSQHYNTRNHHGKHAEDVTIKHLEDLLARKKLDFPVIKIYLSNSPCQDCSTKILNLLGNTKSKYNIDLKVELVFSRLYRVRRPSNEENPHYPGRLPDLKEHKAQVEGLKKLHRRGVVLRTFTSQDWRDLVMTLDVDHFDVNGQKKDDDLLRSDFQKIMGHNPTSLGRKQKSQSTSLSQETSQALKGKTGPEENINKPVSKQRNTSTASSPVTPQLESIASSPVTPQLESLHLTVQNTFSNSKEKKLKDQRDDAVIAKCHQTGTERLKDVMTTKDKCDDDMVTTDKCDDVIVTNDKSDNLGTAKYKCKDVMIQKYTCDDVIVAKDECDHTGNPKDKYGKEMTIKEKCGYLVAENDKCSDFVAAEDKCNKVMTVEDKCDDARTSKSKSDAMMTPKDKLHEVMRAKEQCIDMISAEDKHADVMISKEKCDDWMTANDKFNGVESAKEKRKSVATETDKEIEEKHQGEGSSRLSTEAKIFQMELELMELKLQALRKQHEMERLAAKAEYSALKHLKLYYEIRQLERDLGVPEQLGVNSLKTTYVPYMLHD